MKTYYRINGLTKYAKEDVFNEGRVVDSWQESEVTVEFTGKTPTEVVKAAAAWLGVAFGGRDNGVKLNAADKPGRVDFSRMETANGDTPRQSQFEAWKNGKCRLWAVTYIGTVEKVTVETVTL